MDNIRASTPEALSWVVAMTTGSTTDAERRHLFKLAIDKQVQVAKRTNAGFGIDNHLLALMNLAKEEGTDAVFQVFYYLFVSFIIYFM